MHTLHAWDHDPVAAFNAFVDSAEFGRTSRRRVIAGTVVPLSDASAAVYRFMFGNFAAWMAEQALTLSTLDQSHLFEFLARRHPDGTLRIDSDIARRYLRLLERCYRHLNIVPNPAQAAMLGAARGARQLGRDGAMATLTPDQVGRFRAALPPADAGWKAQRDRAMQLVMLFGGLRVAEATGFMVSEVGSQPSLDGTLELALTPIGKHQSSHPHNTRLAADAVPDLLAWLTTRRRLPFQGKRVFPANFRGDALNKSTVYRQAKATFERAGLEPLRLGGRTLRNTFAVSELDAVSIVELTEHLGLALPRSTDKYVAAKQRLAPAPASPTLPASD